MLGNLAVTNLQVTDNGYLYVYVTDESPVNVDFDNLQIQHSASTLLELNDYYPYGLLNPWLSTTSALNVQNNYKFQSKELLMDVNPNTEDFGWRGYDPVLGRWHVIDPACEQRIGNSQFSSMGCNPVINIDPSGALDGWYTENGVTKYDPKINSQKELANAGIDGSYIGQTLPAGSHLPNGWGIAGDANGNLSVGLPGVNIAAEAPGSPWLRAAIKHYQSGEFFSSNPSVSNYGYCFTNAELEASARIGLTVTSMFIGVGLFSGIEAFSSAYFIRGGLDMSAQFGGEYLRTGDARASFTNINFIHTGMAALGINMITTGLTSSAFSLNATGFESTLTGDISTNQFLIQSGIGLVFNSSGALMRNSTSFKGLTLGTYMNTSLSLGQRTASGLSIGLYQTPEAIATFGESYLGGK